MDRRTRVPRRWLVLGAVLALVAASCGSEDETATEASPVAPSTTATPTAPTADPTDALPTLPPTRAEPAGADDRPVLTALNLDGTVRWEIEATPELPTVDYPRVTGAVVAGWSGCLDDGAGMWDAESGEQLAVGSMGSFDMPLFASGDFAVMVTDTGLKVVDEASGHERWSTTDGSLTLALLVGDVILFGTAEGIEARSLETGTVEWIQTSAELRDEAGDQPSYDVRGWDEERVYVGVAWPGSGLAALSLADGSLSWTARFAPTGEAGMVATADGLVLGNAEGGGVIEARDATTGEVVWTAPGAIPWSNTFSSLGFMADGNLYVAGPAALDPSSGQVPWNAFDLETWDEDGTPGGPKVIPNLLSAFPGGLLVRDHGLDGESIVALDAADGTVMWKHPVAFGSEVAVGADLVVISRSGCYEGSG
jgi:outer membrane protein assembly factor BamB